MATFLIGQPSERKISVPPFLEVVHAAMTSAAVGAHIGDRNLRQAGSPSRYTSSQTPDDAATESLLERNHSGPLFV